MRNINENKEILKAAALALDLARNKVKEIKRSSQIISLEEMALLHKIQDTSTEIYNLTRDKNLYM